MISLDQFDLNGWNERAFVRVVLMDTVFPQCSAQPKWGSYSQLVKLKPHTYCVSL